MHAFRCLVVSIMLLTLSSCGAGPDYGSGGSSGGFTSFRQRDNLQTSVAFNPYSEGHEATLFVIRKMGASADSRSPGGTRMGDSGSGERSSWTLSEENKDWFEYVVVKEPFSETLKIHGREYSLDGGRVFLMDSTKTPAGVTQLDLAVPAFRAQNGTNDLLEEQVVNAAIKDLSEKNQQVKRFVTGTQ